MAKSLVHQIVLNINYSEIAAHHYSECNVLLTLKLECLESKICNIVNCFDDSDIPSPGPTNINLNSYIGAMYVKFKFL